jgi:hypothetical protein
MGEKTSRDTRAVEPQGLVAPTPELLISETVFEHICTSGCDEIPDSGFYDAFNPGVNPTLERHPDELES